MVPGLALWLPSGYSWGALLLLLCTLASARQWLRQPVARLIARGLRQVHGFPIRPAAADMLGARQRNQLRHQPRRTIG